ncbi:MAG: hypothetical protein Q9162_005741 [Coniocarpon cinnabarinum]
MHTRWPLALKTMSRSPNTSPPAPVAVTEIKCFDGRMDRLTPIRALSYEESYDVGDFKVEYVCHYHASRNPTTNAERQRYINRIGRTVCSVLAQDAKNAQGKLQQAGLTPTSRKEAMYVQLVYELRNHVRHKKAVPDPKMTPEALTPPEIPELTKELQKSNRADSSQTLAKKIVADHGQPPNRIELSLLIQLKDQQPVSPIWGARRPMK